MMKSMLVTALALASIGASAADVGVFGGYEETSKVVNHSYGVTVGQKFGSVGLAVEADRSTRQKAQNNRVGVVASYDVATVWGVTLSPKAGVVSLDPEKGPEGFGVVAGLGAELPLGKNLAVTLDYRYQWGQDRVDVLDSNRVFAGVKYRF
jgi:opacity protein-like surface antigen